MKAMRDEEMSPAAPVIPVPPSAPAPAGPGGPAGRVRELIMGFRTTQLLYVAARLRLADRLQDGPRAARDLAPLVGAEPRALHRLMRALAALGLLAQRGDDRFELTPLGNELRSGQPHSHHDLAVLYGEPWLWGAYGAMLHSVRTGSAAFPEVHGQRFFDWLATHDAARATFDAAMGGYSATESAAIADACPEFGTMQHIVDVGGGRGALLRALLGRFERLRATLFDRSQVLDDIGDIGDIDGIDAVNGSRPRLVLRSGDFFEQVEPAGADAYVLKSVIHDWNDEDALTILRACRRAMAVHSRLLLIERLLPDGDPASAPEAVLFDINMLVTLGAGERSAGEYGELLGRAGLRMTRVVPTACPLSIVEATL